MARSSQPLHQNLVEPVIDQRKWHFVDAELLVPLFDDRLALDVAEKRDLVFLLGGDRVFGAADQDIRLDADLTQHPDGMLRRLGFELSGRLQERNQREVDIQAILAADVERKLANRLEKRLTLDVAHSAAYFRDHHVHIVTRERADCRLDLIGDVRNDLYRLSFVETCPSVPSR